MTVPKTVGVVGGGRMGSGIAQVRLAIAEYLAQELGERFAPPRLPRDKVARGELGRKSGQGFYTWEGSR
jgi:3-hydroxyacyl-CoA dehydrogenase